MPRRHVTEIGILGPELGLSLGQSVAAIVVGTWLRALCTAYCGTLGPKVIIYCRFMSLTNRR